MGKLLKVCNLYAGLGGNRKLWTDVEVTAIEKQHDIAEMYREFFPEDEVFEQDAHEHLLKYFKYYDFIWSSPPCQSHSRMIKSGKNRKPRYADLKLYEEIMFLRNNFKGKWVVENVIPYYNPLIEPSMKIGRHLFWSNFDIPDFNLKTPKNFINKTTVKGSEFLKEWLGLYYPGNIYYENNHCPAQVLRNCVHPDLGLHILNSAF